jgi:hypothetical protein
VGEEDEGWALRPAALRSWHTGGQTASGSTVNMRLMKGLGSASDGEGGGD